MAVFLLLAAGGYAAARAARSLMAARRCFRCGMLTANSVIALCAICKTKEGPIRAPHTVENTNAEQDLASVTWENVRVLAYDRAIRNAK